MVKTPHSNAGGEGSIPGRGTGIPRVLWPKDQNINRRRYCNKFQKVSKKPFILKKKNLKKRD